LKGKTFSNKTSIGINLEIDDGEGNISSMKHEIDPVKLK